MWKYLTALVLLLTIGVVGAQIDVCDVCYANIITQSDTQLIENVKIGMFSSVDENVTHNEKVGIGNEALSAAIIVTKAPADAAENSSFKLAPFGRIDQAITQTISGLGKEIATEGEEGAKGLTWNKAIQAAWIANQGVKEQEMVDGELAWVKEGSYIAQTTNQTTRNVYDYDSREEAKVLNLDNKVAMIVDDLETIINLTARANTASVDSQTSIGNITNNVNVTVKAIDP